MTLHPNKTWAALEYIQPKHKRLQEFQNVNHFQIDVRVYYGLRAAGIGLYKEFPKLKSRDYHP